MRCAACCGTTACLLSSPSVFAEDQARRRKQVFFADWQTRLDEFLRFNDRNVLADAGKVSRETADEKAEGEYEQFAARRREQLEVQGMKGT